MKTVTDISVIFLKFKSIVVIGIDQIVIAERPTPGTFQEALTQHHFMLKSKEGKMLHLDLPWGHYDKHQVYFVLLDNKLHLHICKLIIMIIDQFSLSLILVRYNNNVYLVKRPY